MTEDKDLVEDKKTKTKKRRTQAKKYTQPAPKLESEIALTENELLQFRLINTQHQLIKKNIENFDLKKQLLMVENQSILENLNEFKNEIIEKYQITFDQYYIDVEKEKLIKKS